MIQITIFDDNKLTVTTLEILEQINFFRRAEGIQSPMLHKNLLAIVRNEFEEEIEEGKIQPGSYLDKQNQSRILFHLEFNQAKQVLMRESKYVRKSMIVYLDKLQNKLERSKNSYSVKELLLMALEQERKLDEMSLVK